MKSSLLAFSVITACSVVFVGCSDGADNKGAQASPSGWSGLWTEKANVEAWESFKSGTQTAEEACSVYKGYDGETKTEYTNLSSLVWIDGSEYKSCDWSEDWRSACLTSGQISGNTLSEMNDEGEEVAKDLGVDLSPLMKKISEEQVSELYDFMKKTCGVNVDVGMSTDPIEDPEIIQSFDPKLDGRPKK